MADSGKTWKLQYDQTKFQSFHKQLLAELIEDDMSNNDLLSEKYEEVDLPDGPIRITLAAMTGAQRNQHDTALAAANVVLPTKLDLLDDPGCVHGVRLLPAPCAFGTVPGRVCVASLCESPACLLGS